jgi:hypothetical protein
MIDDVALQAERTAQEIIADVATRLANFGHPLSARSTYRDHTGMETAALTIPLVPLPLPLSLLIGVRARRASFAVEGAVMIAGKPFHVLGGMIELAADEARVAALAMADAGLAFLADPQPVVGDGPPCGGEWADARPPAIGERVHFGEECHLEGEWLVVDCAGGRIFLERVTDREQRISEPGRRLSGGWHFRGTKPILISRAG